MVSLNYFIFFILVNIVILRKECFAKVMNSQLTERRNILYSSNSECQRNDDCVYFEECLDNSCTHVCLSKCFGEHETCYGINHTALCRCDAGYSYNFEEKCKIPCIDSSDCPPREECDYGVTNSCQCRIPYIRDLYIRDQCELHHDCHDNNACQEFETCIRNKCRNACSGRNCTKPNQGCIANNHVAMCICESGYSFNRRGDCKKDVCVNDSDCGPFQYCFTYPYATHCACIDGYHSRYDGPCYQLCALSRQCPNDYWCNDRFCVPCDGIMC